jgi:hypothetical protein
MRDGSAVKEVVGLMHPTLIQTDVSRPRLQDLNAESLKSLLRRRIDFTRGCDELEVTFYASIDGLKAGECRIYRIQQLVGGRVVGGYTVVARKQ